MKREKNYDKNRKKNEGKNGQKMKEKKHEKITKIKIGKGHKIQKKMVKERRRNSE